MKEGISVIILTFNEEKHIKRCIESLLPCVKEIFIIDSKSTDKTIEICEELGAKVYQNQWKTYAEQFQWGLDNCPIQTNWIMRMDADEYLLPELESEIKSKLNTIDSEISGIYLKRRVYFLGKWIKHGGYYPIKLLRIWRYGSGSIEQRWMDEHIKLNYGKTLEFENDIVDDNLNNLTWWTIKHNSYATREAVDYLVLKHKINALGSINVSSKSSRQDESKRWYKDNIYNKLPLFLRVVIYFFYRYFIKLGFLDGKKGLIWHVLQGFWYRFLVDAKIYQIEKLAKDSNNSVKRCLEKEYDFKI